jgi:hypothetical protein
MNNEEWFIVKDLDGFVNSSRALVFNNFGSKSEEPDPISLTIDETDRAELDTLLSFEESKIIILDAIKKQKHKISKNIRYSLNEEIFANIITSLNDRMVSNILSGLVKKGLVDSAYDSESNDFVFWVKEKKQSE